MASSSALLEGVLPALVTPFTADGKVDVDAVPKLVEFQISSGCKGFYLCGNTGEGFDMNIEERKVMVDTASKATNGRVPIVVMVTAKTVEDSIELAKHAKASGAQGVSSVVPLDCPNDLDAAVKFWTQVSSATDLPFYIYWMAATADKKATPESFLKAVSSVPNLGGYKFTDTNFYIFQRLRSLAPHLNGVTGPDEMMVGGLALGSHGAIGSTYNLYPKLAASVYDSFKAGKNKEAYEAQDKMNKVISLLIEQCRIPEGGKIHQGIKVLLRRKHGIPCGVSRSGFQFSAEEEEALVKAIDDLGFPLE